MLYLMMIYIYWWHEKKHGFWTYLKMINLSENVIWTSFLRFLKNFNISENVKETPFCMFRKLIKISENPSKKNVLSFFENNQKHIWHITYSFFVHFFQDLDSWVYFLLPVLMVNKWLFNRMKQKNSRISSLAIRDVFFFTFGVGYN